MFVRRKVMEEVLKKEREVADLRMWNLACRYGDTLERVSALQEQLSAWVMNKAENITPEQAAQMFYAQDDRWQAAFFNCMQDQIRAHHDSLSPPRPGGYKTNSGVPAGEAQWYHMAEHLDDSGFETIEAMYDHAKHKREDTK